MARALFRTLVVSTLFATCSWAQNVNIESLSGIRFNFSNPGARSLGMGGAFIGLADDTSAAEANPAGLTILTKREFSVELRRMESRQQYPLSQLTFAGPVTYGEQRQYKTDVTFASMIMPFARGTVGLFYHEPLVHQNKFAAPSSPTIYVGRQQANAPFTEVPLSTCQTIVATRPNDCTQFNLRPYSGNTKIHLRTIGLASAYKLGGLSLGGAVRYHKLSESAPVTRLASTSNPTFTNDQTSHNSDMTVEAGLQWVSNASRFGFGAVAKQGPNVKTFVSVTVGDELIAAGDQNFHVPDLFGVGVFVRPVNALTITADAARVRYTNQTDNFFDLFTLSNSKEFTSRNATEIHVGAELAIRSMANPIYLRAGAWRDPAHGITFTGSPAGAATASAYAEAVAQALFFPKPQSANHVSGGVGFRMSRFDLDAAFDHSSRAGNIASVTLAGRF